MNAKDIVLTSEGYKKIKEELENLINVIRPQVIEELVEARSQGDLSENADYDAVRNRQAEVEARIKELETLVMKAKIVDSKSSGKKEVKVGSTVTVSNSLTKQNMTFKVVSPIEADPFNSKISYESPIAEALIGKGVGEKARIKNIKKPYDVEIISIK
ncbi:transcription elongation factor GreA [Spiroplasma endosymbiont of Crioceris asparagi]|uniref:transcription elongation factor GreA n=1 Tax=Spiroplasma endosymbiont of Crioceris asparagi TaxID=3066286 RepID=UPI0030D1FC7A